MKNDMPREKRLVAVKQVFLDMDGTIYHGRNLFPTTLPFLDFLSAHGIGYRFLSNNSSCGAREYAARLGARGIHVSPDHFYLSTDYAVDYLKRNHPDLRRFFLLGMPCVAEVFRQAGFQEDNQTPQGVIVAFDRNLTYDRLCRAAWFLKQGIPGFATHPDLFCPTDQPTWLPDCGAITLCLESATGVRLKVLGKPDPGLLREAARRCGVTAEQTIMIGDRLATDIAVGVRAGALTCRINGPGADLTPAPAIVPDWEVENLGAFQAIWAQLLD